MPRSRVRSPSSPLKYYQRKSPPGDYTGGFFFVGHMGLGVMRGIGIIALPLLEWEPSPDHSFRVKVQPAKVEIRLFQGRLNMTGGGQFPGGPPLLPQQKPSFFLGLGLHQPLAHPRFLDHAADPAHRFRLLLGEPF